MNWVALSFLLFCALPPLRAAQENAGRDTLSPLVRLLSIMEDPAAQRDILKGMNDGLKGRRSVKMPQDWESVAARLRQSADPRVRELTQSLSVMFGSTVALNALRDQVLDTAASVAARSNALATLLQVKDPQLVPALQQLLKEPSFRGSALKGLAAFDDPATPSVILEAYPDLTTREKNVALATLSARPAYGKALAQALAGGRLPARDLTADIVRQLGSLNIAEVNEQIARHWGVTRESSADKEKEMGRLEKLLQNKGFGSASRGRVIFSKVCLQCHSLFGEGAVLGPDLTAANRADTDYLLRNVVDPNALIPNDYRSWNLETKDDRSITGIVTRQDEKTVTIVTAAETLVIPRSEVASMKQGELSLMPEGLLQALTDDEIRDLFGYLRSSTQVPMPPGAR